AIRPQAVALGLFGLLSVVVALVAVGQVLVRQVTISGEDQTLRALRMDRRRVVPGAIAPAVLACFVGAVVPCVVALVASRWMPIGPARLAEPDPGIRPDPLVFVIGFVAGVVSMVLIAAWPAWRASTAGPSTSSADVRGRRRVVRLDEWAT